MPRLQRLTDFIARLLGKEWDVRALDRQRSSPASSHPGDSRGRPDEPPTISPYVAGPVGPADSADSTDSTTPADSSGPSEPARATASAQTLDASRTWSSTSDRSEEDPAAGGQGADRPSDLEPTEEEPQVLTLARIESMLTGPMEYNVQLTEDREHPCLLGTWDSFPFVIEIPEGHDGWLLVSGDWEEAAPASQRDEIAASVNDWNRDKFFPTVGVIDTPIGPLVRATYLTDLSAGATDAQLRLHLDTALSACTQALSLVGPLLPEI
ncbi:histidine kinase [Actinomyces oris]|nr:MULTISPECIES: YbjN domain-containing protein [Actinomyces]OLO63722.1 histidine kinase [Actinomyces oris]